MGSAGGWTNHLQVDALGRTLKVEQKAADLAVQILEYSYATNGFVKTMKYPSGRVVNYAQSNAGRTVSATGSGTGEQYASGLTYGANGAMLGAVWNGTGTTRLVEARSYNWLGQMLVAEVKKGGTELKWKITNEYGDLNNNGNLNKQWTETGAAIYGVRFAYDAVNRIRGAAEDAPGEGSLATASCSTVGGTWCVKYRADGFGNLWTENKSATAAGVAAMSQAAYDAATNRLTAAGYYANGNQKHWVLNEAKSRAEYDADGKMVRAGRVTENEGTVWDAAQALTTLTYNGAGQRVKKTVTQGAATQTVPYVYGLDGEVAAEWESAPTGGGGRQYLVGDHLGSTRVRLDANGEVLQRIDYEPFGTEVQRTGVSGYGGGNAVSRKFTGKERDAETGLDYFGARYMSSAQGRFTSPDAPGFDQWTVNPQSWNLYGYVRNNPLRYIDPTGRKCVNLDGGGQGDDGLPGPACPESAGLNTTHGITVGGGDVTPVQVGWEWLSGTGPRQRTFTEEDRFTQMLRQHKHVETVVAAIQTQLGNCQTPTPQSLAADGTNPNYNLSGIEGVPKYLGDYSTLATGGTTGNLAVTYLGSYGLSFNVSNVNSSAGTASVSFHLTNTSTIASGTRPPVIGYTPAWQNTVGRALNGAFQTGPMSATQQDFFWTQQVSFNGNSCR